MARGFSWKRGMSWLAAGAVLSIAAAPGNARACGGTFCDTGPAAMPVDQSGENILFVLDGDETEAHVQIQYTGDPERFAWVVPMPSVPDVQVGSNQLFVDVLGATVPTYGFQTQRQSCGPQPLSANADESFGGKAGAVPPQASGPDVVLRKTVGVFDVVVLSGGTAQEVNDWLVTNDYQTADTAPALLDPYVQSGFVFAAIKLTAGTGLDEIHPISFRYTGQEPSIPIRLTAVAATADMGLRVFVLGSDRAVPVNYKHLVLNPVRIDWASFGSNYNDVVTGAADTETAEGRAFATEYAGPSSIVPSGNLHDPQWDPPRFETIDPVLVVDELQVQGLANCSPGFCQFNHPLVLPLLQEYLPRPAGVSDEDFYACLSCYEAQADFTAWDGVAFARALDERIVTPALHAEDLLSRNPYLTRLFSTISPDEMTEDPVFREVSGLDDVALPTTATMNVRCSGLSIMELPDEGPEVVLTDTGAWPTFTDMPFALRVEELTDDGTLSILTDNSLEVDRQLKQSNSSLRGSSGCACRTQSDPGSRAPYAGLLFGAMAFGIARRRRVTRGRRG